MRNCKVKTTGIALSVDASVPPASAARGMGVHALSNHGKARAQGRDAARECRAFKVIRARSVLNRAATALCPKRSFSDKQPRAGLLMLVCAFRLRARKATRSGGKLERSG
jgi:hypothetical protein